MTAHGRYASSDSSFGRSTGNAAARGGALIAVAVVIGFLLLWKGGIGGSDATAVNASDDATTESDVTTEDPTAAEENTDAAVDDNDDAEASTDDGTDGETAVDDPTEQPTETVPEVPTTRPVGEVKVAVANGVGEAGLAGARAEVLSTAGYTIAAVNAAADTAQSAVYYVADYGTDAEGVAVELGADASVLRPMPDDAGALVADATTVDGFQVIVILGSDRALG